MTDIIAHRGSKGTHPENTLIAFQEALDVGVDGIELDVHLSKDQQLVVIHDETINRTTNGTGVIRKMNVSEIQKYDAGSWFDPKFKEEKIPTFGEVLALLEKNQFQGLLNIEMKTDKTAYKGIEQKLFEVMNSQEWAFTYCYSSFNFNSLERMEKFDSITHKALVMHQSNKKIQRALATNFIEAIHPSIIWFEQEQRDLSNFPKKIRPWTVNEVEDIEFAFSQNLSGIHTDFPEKALLLRDAKESKNKTGD